MDKTKGNLEEVEGGEMNHLSIVGFGRNRAAADFYPTPDFATEELLKREQLIGNVWEPACGDGAIAKFFPGCLATDLRTDLGYGEGGIDFLTTNKKVDNIITNPPYSLAQKFIEHSFYCADKQIVMLLKLVFLESISRKSLFDRKMLKRIWVFRKRLKIYANGIVGKNSGLIAYAWFVWDKNYNGLPIVDWI